MGGIPLGGGGGGWERRTQDHIYIYKGYMGMIENKMKTVMMALRRVQGLGFA